MRKIKLKKGPIFLDPAITVGHEIRRAELLQRQGWRCATCHGVCTGTLKLLANEVVHGACYVEGLRVELREGGSMKKTTTKLPTVAQTLRRVGACREWREWAKGKDWRTVFEQGRIGALVGPVGTGPMSSWSFGKKLGYYVIYRIRYCNMSRGERINLISNSEAWRAFARKTSLDGLSMEWPAFARLLRSKRKVTA